MGASPEENDPDLKDRLTQTAEALTDFDPTSLDDTSRAELLPPLYKVVTEAGGLFMELSGVDLGGATVVYIGGTEANIVHLPPHMRHVLQVMSLHNRYFRTEEVCEMLPPFFEERQQQTEAFEALRTSLTEAPASPNSLYGPPSISAYWRERGDPESDDFAVALMPPDDLMNFSI